VTVQELINELESFERDAQVRIAQQPHWPFEYSVGEVVEANPSEAYDLVRDGDDWYVLENGEETAGPFQTVGEAERALEAELNRNGPPETVVYIGEGRQLAYLSGAARQALGW
jgi:hypothetical protein